MDPLTIALAAAAAGTVAAGSSLLVWAIKRWNAKYLKIWTKVARRVGGEIEPPSGPWYKRTPMTIKARLHDVGVVVDHYTVSTGNSSQTYTRCRARALGATTLKLKVKKSGVASGLGRSLGFQDLATGDALFDDRFVVKTSDEDLARAWLDEEARTALMPLKHYTLEIKGGELKAIRSDMEKNPAALAQAINAVGALGAGGRRILHRWRDLAEAMEGDLLSEVVAWAPDASVQVEAERRGARVVVDATRKDASSRAPLLTRVRCHLVTGGAERCVVSRDSSRAAGLRPVELPEDLLPDGYKASSESPEETALRLTPRLCRRLSGLRLTAVEVDGQTITVLLDGLVFDAGIIYQAADLALDLASNFSEGVYR